MVGNSSFKVGLYIRLSRDDGNVESDSIVSQRSLLNQYVKENNYVVVDEYVDDGFSGTNFDRPSFKRMMNDIVILVTTATEFLAQGGFYYAWEVLCEHIITGYLVYHDVRLLSFL